MIGRTLREKVLDKILDHSLLLIGLAMTLIPVVGLIILSGITFIQVLQIMGVLILFISFVMGIFLIISEL